MNSIKIFENQEFGQVRTIEEEGKILFCGSDVARALGYDQPHKAIERHCRYGMKCTIPHPQSESKTIEMIFIPEGDLYRLIANSKLPYAEKFESWVFDEVMPSIRRTGQYDIAEKFKLPRTFSEALRELADKCEENERLQQENQLMLPKAEFFDQVADSKDAIDIGSAAKILNMGVGRNRLFEIMREKRILMENNQPYQSYIDRGYFRTVEQKFTKPDGTTCINIKTLVYQKGLNHIRKILESAKMAG